MVKKNGASRGNFMGWKSSIDGNSVKDRKIVNSGIDQTRAVTSVDGQTKEHFEDAERLFRTALMDCYNG